MTATKSSATQDADSILRDRVRQLLGLPQDAPVALLHVNGWEMDGTRRTLLAFRHGERVPALVVKVGRGAGREAVAAEHANLRQLARSESAELRGSVPRVLDHVASEEADVEAVFTSALDGTPSAHALARRGNLAAFVSAASDWLLLLHAPPLGQRVALDDALVDTLVRAPLAEYLERFRPDAGERAMLERTVRAAESLRGTDVSLAPRHGDFCAANILLDGEALRVIDWEAPLEPRLPGGDLVHLLADLACETEDAAALETFDRTFLCGGPLASVAREALARHATQLDLPRGLMRISFTVYWAEYAIEKVTLGRRAGGGQAASPGDGATPWGLVAIADGTCDALRHLSRHEDRLIVP